MIEIALAFVVAFAAATQRITGIGFALICTPFLVLGLGAVHGVLIANVLCVVLNVIVLGQTWRNVDARKIVFLVLAALIAIPFGHYALNHLPRSILLMVVGGLVLGAIGFLRWQPKIPRLPENFAALLAGALSGFMNVTAGVGGPAIALYAKAQKWEQKSFVASIQLYFLIINTASVFAEDPAYIRQAHIGILLCGLLAGSLAGHYGEHFVSAGNARKGTIFVATAGALIAIVKGAALLWPHP